MQIVQDKKELYRMYYCNRLLRYYITDCIYRKTIKTKIFGNAETIPKRSKFFSASRIDGKRKREYKTRIL